MSFRSPQLGCFVLLVLAACTGPSLPTALDDTGVGDDALIAFPAAAYASAPLMSYGSTTTRPFRATDGFVAVKFNGRKGDLVRFGASTTTGSAAVAYLVFNKQNVGAIRVAGDPPGAYRYTLSVDGEYFVMMRSANKARATLRAKLELLDATPPPPPTDSKTFSNAPYVAAAKAGTAPTATNVGIVGPIAISYRRCYAATGCQEETPASFGKCAALVAGAYTLFPSPEGPVVRVQLGTSVDSPGATLSLVDGTEPIPEYSTLIQTNFSGPFCNFKKPVEPVGIRAKLQATVAGPKLSMESVRIYDDAAHTGWVEILASEATSTWVEPKPAPRYPDLPSVSVPELIPAGLSRVPMDDETVISRFAAGQPLLDVHEANAMGGTLLADQSAYYIDQARTCAPRTGCSAPDRKMAMRASDTGELSRDVLAFGSGSLRSASLGIAGVDSYNLQVGIHESGSLSRTIVIPIHQGMGMHNGYKVTITAQGALFEPASRPIQFPAIRTPLSDVSYPAPQGGNVLEGGYFSLAQRNPEPWTYLFIPFNRNW